MKPAPFAYDAPESLDEALDLLARYGDAAKVLAGGQSLVPLLNFRLARPERLIDINRIDELAYIRSDGDGVRIGALTRTAALERSGPAAEGWPILREAVRHSGHPQIRNRGTVGGSVAHADPAAELPVVLAALGARFVVRSARGTRTVDARDLFVGYLTTALEADELLVEIAVPPLPDGAGTAFVEYARVHGDFALAGAAAVHAGGATTITLLGAGPVPVAEIPDDVAAPRRALLEDVAARAVALAKERAA